MSMLKQFKKVFTEILKNFDLYGTILVSIVVIVLGIMGIVSPNIISSATLAVLALLASALLRIRNTGEKKMTLSDIFQFRSQLPQLEIQLADAQSLDVCAMSNVSLGTTQKEFLVDKMKQGCCIRIILLNPYNLELMKAISPIASPSLDHDDHTAQIVTALNSLARDPRLANTDRFQMRIYDYALPHSITIINGNTPQGKLRIEAFMSNRLPAQSPGFYVRKSEESYWFNYFQSEFESIWQRAKPPQM
jgi:hypothetical protein